MIEKMKFLSITGPKADIDRVVNTYLSKYEIHLENALSELTAVESLSPFMEINPYKEALSTANSFYDELADPEKISAKPMDTEQALNTIRRIQSDYQELSNKRADLESQLAALDESLRVIRPFRNINYNISSILKFQFIHFRFGRIEKEYYQKFEKYIYENLDTIFIKCDEDDQYVWGLYFVPEHEAQKVKAVYSSMHFERIYMPDTYEGTAKEAFEQLTETRNRAAADLASADQKKADFLLRNQKDIVASRNAIAQLSGNFDVRRLAACTHGDKDVFYILCGWMTEKDAHSFQNDIKDDSRIFCIIDGEEDEHLKPGIHQQPPTKLKNPKLFKPFEMYIKMYGLPAYNEMDPTWFVALTYSFIFGAMFGDAGQGLVLLIGGYLLYHFKKINLAAVLSSCGFFSTIFGLLYGSVFGFEDWIPALWLRPTEAMTNLPVIGTLNTVFVVTITIGMGLILLTMIFHMINSLREKRPGEALFDTNGLAGFVFYGAVVAVIMLFMTGHTIPAAGVLVVMFVVPLLVIVCKEPLSALVEKKKYQDENGPVMFVVQGFFELFEVLLSYLSNTLSFLRIGAFAVSHAAMMEVVLMLSGASAGSTNWIIFVIGNIIVCGLEGLVVGIQVLRLEYYEMFSRFYKGTGREFKPFHKQSE